MAGHRFSGWVVLVLTVLVLGATSAPASAARWEPLPLWGGTAQVAAGDSSVVYAAAPAAGLYRSADRGATWQFVGDAPNRLPFQILGVDPHDPRRLYIASGEAGAEGMTFFHSEDGGRHWRRSDAGIPGSVLGLAFDPETPGRIYAAATFGLYRSEDGGAAWTRIAFDDVTVFQVAVAPGNPAVVLASTDQEELGTTLRSTDGGEGFLQVFDRAVQQFLFDPARPGRLYGLDIFGNLHRSEDLGATWTSLSSLPFTFRVLAVTPAGILLAGSYGPGVARSLDGGATWEAATSSAEIRPPDVIGSFAVLDGEALAGGVFQGVWKSLTDGRGWRPARTGIRAQWIDVLEVAPGSGPTLWVGAQAGFFKSRDGGASFQPRRPGPGPFGILDVLAVHPRQPQIAYAFGCCAGEPPSYGLMKTEDGGRSWRRLPYNGILRDVAVVEVDPVDPDIVYAGGFFEPHGSSCTALRSTDGGETWSCLNRQGISDFDALAIDPHDPRVLYALFNDALYRSTDRGEAWEWLPDLTGLGRLVSDPTRRNRLYAIEPEGPAVYRSDNGGRSWNFLTNELPPDGIVRDLLVDASGRVWAAVETRAVGVRKPTGHVFSSDDAGRHWSEVSAGLRGAIVLHLAADPREAGVVYAGTAGQGLFRLRMEE